MTRYLLALVIGVAALLGTRPAAADPYFNESVWASPVYDRTVCGFPTWQSVAISTADLKDGLLLDPDTFLIVYSGFGTYYNDDVSGGSKASAVSAATTDGCFHIIVFASYWLAAGTADIYVDGQIVDNDVPFGGTLVPLTNVQPNVYSIHTVHRPASNQATRTDLYLFDDTWTLLDYDDQSGAGQQATNYNETLYSSYMVLVASDSQSTEGYTDLAINDCVIDPDRATSADACKNRGYDYDGDFLANSLEDDIVTNRYAFDTDNDGLFDYYELIGRFEGGQVNYISQGFSGMGANPRRRDIFLEFDTGNIHDDTDGDGDMEDVGDIQPPDEASMEIVQAVFNDLPQLPLNHDGTTGISVHADVGSPVCSDPSLCGDWGGTDLGLPYDHRYAYHYDEIKQFGHFYAMRHGLFHYVYLVDYKLDPEVYGKVAGKSANVPASSFSALWDGPSLGAVISHELGHNLGLAHWGDPAATVHQNKKGAYPSLMNYLYARSLPGVLSYRGRFSEGRMDPIRLIDLDENSYSMGIDKTYLTSTYFHYTIAGDSVDFNYDGRTGVPGQPGDGVRYDTAPMDTRLDEESGWPEFFQDRPILGDYRAAQSAGDIVVLPGVDYSELWAFSVGRSVSGDPLVSYSTITNIIGDPEPWPVWNASITTTGCYFPTPVSGELSATRFEMAAGERIILTYPDVAGLCYLVLDPSFPSAAGTWHHVPGWPTGVVIDNASVGVVDGKLTVMFIDGSAGLFDDNTYVATMDDTGTWLTQPTLATDVHSFLTPGFVEAPDGYVYIAVVADDADRSIFLGRKPVNEIGTSTSWAAVPNFTVPSFLGEYQGGDGSQRINLVFLPYLDEVRQPFSDGSGYLAFFWSSGLNSPTSPNPDRWVVRRAYSTGYIGPSISDLHRPEGVRTMAGHARPKPDKSLAIDVREGGALLFFMGTTDTDIPYDRDAWFVPFASGLPPFITAEIDGNHDHNDAATINANLCRSAWLLAAGANASCVCAQGDPDAVCSQLQAQPVYPMEEPCTLDGP